jgi:predicted solute-binding protein
VVFKAEALMKALEASRKKKIIESDEINKYASKLLNTTKKHWTEYLTQAGFLIWKRQQPDMKKVLNDPRI